MNQEHVNNLDKGKDFWNEWRRNNFNIEPDFTKAQLTNMDSYLRAPLKRRDLRGYDLRGANFKWADLRAVDLSEANLSGACLNEANLEEANLTGTNFKPQTNLPTTWVEEANLSKACLYKANLSSVQLWGANLSRANCSNALFCHANLGVADLFEANFSNTCLRGANLQGARLVKTNFENADLGGSSVWGVSAWDLNLKGAIQSNLTVTPEDSAALTVDDLEIAQFLYLLLSNDRLRNVIDNMVQKAVLILGRFTPERLDTLKIIREELRKYDYLPILFDFQPSAARNITETVSTVAHLSRFIIADLTEPQAIPQELQRIVPQLRIPVVPIFQPSLDVQTGKTKNEWGMFWDYRECEYVLPVYDYESIEDLLNHFSQDIITPAEDAVRSIQEMRRKLKEEKFRVRERRSRKS